LVTAITDMEKSHSHHGIMMVIAINNMEYYYSIIAW